MGESGCNGEKTFKAVNAMTRGGPFNLLPGTSWSEGGPLLDKHSKLYGPVPEQRCALCRFRITGPQFLPGLVLEANNLMFKLKKTAKIIRELSERALDNQPPTVIREIQQEIETLNNISNLDWQEWQAIVRLIAKANEVKGAANGKELIQNTLQAYLQEGTEFSLLHSITMGMELFPAQHKIHNTEAMLEKHEAINRLLMAEGINPFLIALPQASKLCAGNKLSEAIIRSIPTADLDEVTLGGRPLPDQNKALLLANLKPV
jgi:hypothetical protein